MTNHKPDINDQLLDLKDFAEKSKVKVSPEIEKFIQEGSEKLQAKILAKQKLTKADVKFMEVAKTMIRLENLIKAELPAQYAQQVETLKAFGFLNEKGVAKKGTPPFPTQEKTMASLPAFDLKMALDFQTPTLVLVPPTAFIQMTRAIDRQSGKNWKPCQIGNEYGRILPFIAEGWLAYVAEGAETIVPPAWNDPKLPIENKIKLFRSTKRPGVRGMTLKLYAMLMMQALHQGKPLDVDRATVFDEELPIRDPKGNDVSVYRGGWSSAGQNVNFEWFYLYYPYEEAVFRSCVGGTVLI